MWQHHIQSPLILWLPLTPQHLPSPLAPSLHAAINQVLNAWVRRGGGSHRGRWCALGAQATSICAWQRRKWRQEITVTLHSGCRAGSGRAGGGGWGSEEALIIKWKGENEGFFLNCSSHLKNSLMDCSRALRELESLQGPGFVFTGSKESIRGSLEGVSL